MLACEAGEVDKHLKKERDLYDEAIKEAKTRQESSSSMPLPISEGIIVFDEVHVAMKLQWSSRNDRLMGYAMNRDDMRSLCDVYEMLGDNFIG